ncbi:quinolinate synthase NadA [Baileyella intestinalis]|uniref:quinolinate synthase NadA n=1 Tax=Baileyella intestinalis TaxID=2606709 RepID=UPI003A895429
MNTRELQDRIIEMKKKNDVCILAHAYQSQDIWEVADFIGDSFALSKKAAATPQKTIVMSGVRFMAETCKTLSPDKKVILANPVAGCPMAMEMNREDVLKMQEENPGYATVAYINTTAELKTAVDVVVTSSSAVKIISALPDKNILFIPDPNLGDWVQKQCPEKNFKFYNGGCPTHMRTCSSDVKRMRAAHPDALLLVHPECRPSVVEMADYVGSTTGIMKYAGESDASQFIIGTEASIVQHLQFQYPDKQFYLLSENCVCYNMKMTTLMDVYNAVAGKGGEEIVLPEEVITLSRKPIDRMIQLGG